MGERKACKRFGGYAECGHDCRRCGFTKAEMERRKKLKQIADISKPPGKPRGQLLMKLNREI